jgi:hypothetical protein
VILEQLERPLPASWEEQRLLLCRQCSGAQRERCGGAGSFYAGEEKTLVPHANKLEMFARERVRGWDSWGLEASTGIGRRRWKSNESPKELPLAEESNCRASSQCCSAQENSLLVTARS